MPNLTTASIHTAWMRMRTVRVLSMTAPGLVLFCGGMFSVKNGQASDQCKHMLAQALDGLMGLFRGRLRGRLAPKQGYHESARMLACYFHQIVDALILTTSP
jgi:hypothetical protein